MKNIQRWYHGDNHPMAWYQEFDGGRSFYTAGGHTDATFSEPLFLRHLGAGLRYVMGGDSPKSLDYTKVKSKLLLMKTGFKSRAGRETRRADWN